MSDLRTKVAQHHCSVGKPILHSTRVATNKVATEFRNTIWTHDRILCGLTVIPTHLRAADGGSQMGRGGIKRGAEGQRAAMKKTSKVAKE